MCELFLNQKIRHLPSLPSPTPPPPFLVGGPAHLCFKRAEHVRVLGKQTNDAIQGRSVGLRPRLHIRVVWQQATGEAKERCRVFGWGGGYTGKKSVHGNVTQTERQRDRDT